MSLQQSPGAVPMPVVRFNRAILLSMIAVAILIRQPLLTTLLFLLILPAVIFGRKASLIFFVGSRLFANTRSDEPPESPELMRFNNAIALILLGAAQIAFLFGASLVGWILSGIVALAATIALCGFCLGCVLYYQFNMQRYRLFGRKPNQASGQ